MENLREKALQMHRELEGKLKVESKVRVETQEDLALAYSPGVAEPCLEIEKDPAKSYEYTSKGNLIAIVSNGTAVLGLGDIGPLAALPVMEGKCVLFKEFAGVDAFPLCINSKNIDEIVEFVKLLEPTFSGINLEDIAAPDCFEIENRLKKETNMAIFHDDQHGTAIVTMAALFNALKVTNKKIDEIKIVMSGAGAASVATLKLLLNAGVKDAIICDSTGIIWRGRSERMTPVKEELAELTNKDNIKGSVSDALHDADVFIGLSKGNLIDGDDVRKMKKDPIIFAMANPIPEIMPQDAFDAGAIIVGTGRSDFPNQLNNVLAFPGVFRGALDVRAKDINEEMKIAAARAMADLIVDELSVDKIIPSPFDPRVAPTVAGAVAKAAMETGVARIKVNPQTIVERTYELTKK